MIPEVANRYLPCRKACQLLEIWKQLNQHVRGVEQGWTLRIQAPMPFRLAWSRDDWQTAVEFLQSPTFDAWSPTSTTLTSLGAATRRR